MRNGPLSSGYFVKTKYQNIEQHRFERNYLWLIFVATNEYVATTNTTYTCNFSLKNLEKCKSY